MKRTVVKAEGALLGTLATPLTPYNLTDELRGPLKPWMRRYASWLALQEKRPTPKERANKIQSLLGSDLPGPKLDHIEQRLDARVDFQAEVQRLQNDDIAHARAIVQEGSVKAMQAHMEAIDWAVAEKSYKEIGRLTIPIMDRVWQKNSDAPGGAPQVVINIGAQSFAGKLLTAEVIPDAQVEVIQQPTDD